MADEIITTYYVLSSEFLSPNPAQNLNTHIYQITTVPGTTNMSHEVRTSGWLGTTNDTACYAHGEFDSIEEARAAIITLCGSAGCAEIETTQYDGYEGVLESYRHGQYEDMSGEQTTSWCYESICAVQASTTDAEIGTMVAELEEFANGDGYSLDLLSLNNEILKRRSELRDESLNS